MTINRRQIRENLMQILYAQEISKEDIQKVVKDLLSDTVTAEEKSKNFAHTLLELVVANRKVIDEYIVRHADNWELERMTIIDRNLMRIALAEILFIDDVPPKVSINEAIEIAKKYSTEKSSKFVNGILDATLNELKAAGKLSKSGRGLLDTPAKKPKGAAPPVAAPKPIPVPQVQKPAPKPSAGKGGYQGGGQKGGAQGNQTGQGAQSAQGGQGGYQQNRTRKDGGASKPKPNSQGGNRKV